MIRPSRYNPLSIFRYCYSLADWSRAILLSVLENRQHGYVGQVLGHHKEPGTGAGIPHTNGQLHGKIFHLMMSWWHNISCNIVITKADHMKGRVFNLTWWAPLVTFHAIFMLYIKPIFQVIFNSDYKFVNCPASVITIWTQICNRSVAMTNDHYYMNCQPDETHDRSLLNTPWQIYHIYHLTGLIYAAYFM